MNLIKYIINGAIRRGLFRVIPDKSYLKLIYRIKMGKKLNLKNPVSYTEKIQWLKLYNRNPLYTVLVDKYDVRDYIKEKIGEEYLIPLVGGPWNNYDEINISDLPKSFVLKTTHDSGGVYICENKSKFDKNIAQKKLSQSLKTNFYWRYREWPYKNVKPRIIAEKYMVDESGYELKDYKFFVFDGVVKMLFIATNRNSSVETCFDFFDRDFNHLPFENGHPNAECVPLKPNNFDEMIQLAEKLGKDFPHVRVDLYNINGKIYFGEMTMFHFSGITPFNPEKWDYKLGGWLTLPEKKKL